jgi:hypothetical protein
MSKKYIAQVNSTNFVYPNNTLVEYDVDIIHDINNNSVSGTTSGFSAAYNSGTGNIGVSFTYIWNKNGADPYIDESNLLHVLSVHMTEPSKEYYKPWRMVSGVTTSTITATTKTDTFTFIVTPSMMGVNSFSNGVYNFEIRFIGKRAIYPLCYSTSIVLPSPTPTPTVTPTTTPGLSPSPTPTPTPTPSATSGVTYDYYTADVFDCTNCAESIDTILVAFTAGTSVTLNRFYIPVGGPDGNSYRVVASASPGVAYILTNIYGSFTTCALACIV